MKMKFTSFFACAFLLAHALAAVILCRERIYLDAAYYFFHVVNAETFRIEHQRIILALSQCLLLPAVMMHCRLTFLLQIYSITPIVYAAVLIYISLRYFGSESGAWLIMLANVCGTYFLYYCAMYEVTYAAVSLCFLWLLTEKKFYRTPLQFILYFLVMAVVLFGYPLMSIGIVIMFLYQYVVYRRWHLSLILAHLAVIGIWLAVKYFFISDYERSKFSVSPDDYPAIVRSMVSLHFAQQVISFMWQYYTVQLVSIVIVTLYALRRRQYVLALFAPVSVSVFMLIVTFSYRGGGLVHSNNFERMYLLLTPICLAPLVFYIYCIAPSYAKGLLIACACIVCTYSSIHIWEHHHYYTQRISVIEHTYRTYSDRGCSKAALKWDFDPQFDEWSSGVEALIYSSEKGKSIILSDSAMLRLINKDHVMPNNQFLFRLDEVMHTNQLNRRYFKIDTTAYCY